MKTSFIVHHNWYDNIKDLTDEQKARLLDAIFHYEIYGTVDLLDPIVKMAFGFMKQSLDANRNKYDSIVERNKANGSKGGRPSKTQEPKKPTGLSENNKKIKSNTENQKPTGLSRKSKTDNSNHEDDKTQNLDTVTESDTVTQTQGYSRSKFIKNKLEILESAKIKYPDKNCDKAIEDFIEKTGIKNYKYSDYRLAFFRWVRKDTFDEYRIKSSKLPNWEPPKVQPASKETIEATTAKVKALFRK